MPTFTNHIICQALARADTFWDRHKMAKNVRRVRRGNRRRSSPRKDFWGMTTRTPPTVRPPLRETGNQGVRKGARR